MPTDRLGPLPSAGAQGASLDDNREAMRRDVMPASDEDSGLLAAAEREQLERDIAAIECASAALRQAEPALQSWTNPPAPTMQKPRPLWLLIGVLWLSTALVTLGAVFMISVLVG